jgi:MFS family permease
MLLRAFEKSLSSKKIPIYLINLLFSVHYAGILFINSSFLSKFFPTSDVSLLYVLGAIGNIILFLYAPKLLKKEHTRKLFFIFLGLEVLATGGLALTNSASLAVIFFLTYSSVAMMVYYCLDIFLEDLSVDSQTGGTRGVYLTFSNIAESSAPLLVTFLAPTGNFSGVYIASTLIILPIFYIALRYLKKTTESPGHESSSVLSFSRWWRNIEIRKATATRFTLEIFYTIMTIYVPIYLHEKVGFSWGQIGVLFSVMLSAFLLFELPAGELADHWSSEREIMTVGFFIMGLSLLAMVFSPKSFVLWAVLLFFSRIGASFTEVTGETHLFRNVTKDDTGLISIFRLTRPTSIVLGAVLGAVSIALFPFKSIFIVLSIIVFAGMIVSAHLHSKTLYEIKKA